MSWVGKIHITELSRDCTPGFCTQSRAEHSVNHLPAHLCCDGPLCILTQVEVKQKGHRAKNSGEISSSF